MALTLEYLEQGSNREVTEGFMATLEKIGILIEVRRMADEFIEMEDLREHITRPPRATVCIVRVK